MIYELAVHQIIIIISQIYMIIELINVPTIVLLVKSDLIQKKKKKKINSIQPLHECSIYKKEKIKQNKKPKPNLMYPIQILLELHNYLLTWYLKNK